MTRFPDVLISVRSLVISRPKKALRSDDGHDGVPSARRVLRAMGVGDGDHGIHGDCLA